jgi:uncharacterized MAPEG superfamily protein
VHPAFAAGVLATQVTGASPHLAAIFAITYVVARTLYAIAYLADVAVLRSLVWTIGFAVSIGLMVLPIVG